MSKKKTSKKASKKTRKKGRTAAQRAATKKLVALNKGKKKGSKKTRKKKGSKKAKSKGGWRQHHGGGSGLSVGEQFANSGGKSATIKAAERAARAEVAKHYRASTRHKAHVVPSAAKKARKKAKKESGVVTAASILRGAREGRMKVYVCAGPKRSGCGGGKRGAHVVGHIR